jgi:hypothetical protein
MLLYFIILMLPVTARAMHRLAHFPLLPLVQMFPECRSSEALKNVTVWRHDRQTAWGKNRAGTAQKG